MYSFISLSLSNWAAAMNKWNIGKVHWLIYQDAAVWELKYILSPLSFLLPSLLSSSPFSPFPLSYYSAFPFLLSAAILLSRTEAYVRSWLGSSSSSFYCNLCGNESVVLVFVLTFTIRSSQQNKQHPQIVAAAGMHGAHWAISRPFHVLRLVFMADSRSERLHVPLAALSRSKSYQW